jgi:hypothetical protein
MKYFLLVNNYKHGDGAKLCVKIQFIFNIHTLLILWLIHIFS